MMRGILFFIVVFGLVYGTIEVFRGLTGKEKWDLIKSLSYSGLIAAVALVIVVVMVVVF